MSDRDKIFAAIDQALRPLPTRTEYPAWDDSLAVEQNFPQDKPLKEVFRQRLERVHGRFIDGVTGLAKFLRELDAIRGYVDPELLPSLEAHLQGIDVSTTIDRARIDDYAFGITRAAGAIAETGSIILKDRITSARLGALAPWVHIAVLEEKDVYPTVPGAIADFDDDPSIIFATGPSKTADIEGILIEGVHGPGVQAVCWI